MDVMNFLCKNCNHEFRFHEMSTFELWYCDYDNSCQCNYFEHKQASGNLGDEIEVQYDNESYRWN